MSILIVILLQYDPINPILNVTSFNICAMQNYSNVGQL